MIGQPTYIVVEPRTAIASEVIARGLRMSRGSSGKCTIQDETARGDYVALVSMEANLPGVVVPMIGGSLVPAVGSEATNVGDAAYSAAGGKFSADSDTGVYVGVWTQGAGGDGQFGEIEIATVATASGPPSLTNAEKLSLPAATPAGQQVRVSDAFSMVGGAGTTGFWYPFTTLDGRPAYLAALPGASQGDGILFCQWIGGDGAWQINNAAGESYYRAVQDVASPWLVTLWTDNEGNPIDQPVLTNPPLQSLLAPDTSLTAAFVSGCGTTAAIGIYVVDGSGVFVVLSNGGTVYIITESVLGLGDWKIMEQGGFGSLYDAAVAVPGQKPWDVMLWVANNGVAPVPTVTSVTTGQLVSGWKLGSIVYLASGSLNGRNLYVDVLGVAPNLGWDGTKWTDGTTNGSGDTAFPDIGTADPVASEANWITL